MAVDLAHPKHRTRQGVVDGTPGGTLPKRRKTAYTPYRAPAGGWGSVRSLIRILWREHAPSSTALVMAKQNKADGFACVSCAWAKPARPHPFEFCENGAKSTAWEISTRRAGPEFFAAHSLGELEAWPDYDLEQAGRLTHPLRWDAATDRYVPVEWAAAFEEIGRELRALEPRSAVFYASGRASLETSYMYALFARMYGCNNLPDSSNMCHESTSVALAESIGVPVGTVVLEDFEKTDCILFFGQNVGSNSPRMLHQLQEARRRGVPIIVFNPLRERGLERFTNPQAPVEMATQTVADASTRIATQYHQVKTGGDLAALVGLAKAVIALDDEARARDGTRVLDAGFVEAHTAGFDAFEAYCRAAEWAEIERRSGLSRAALEAAATVYGRAKAAIGIYGMGLTQHRKGVQTVQTLVDLMLLGGHIGRPGAGICPVRGHSNVQGQRTVGISEKPALVPLDRIARQFGFEPPREEGLATVDACEGILAGTVRAFIGLGGNFLRAVPEQPLVEAGWRKLRLTVQIATKLNRSHLVHGEIAYVLPCLGRTEIDIQAGVPQAVSVEDSTACIHGSKGHVPPASPHLRSEPFIVAGIAKATLSGNPRLAGVALDWDAWVGDYSKVRAAIAETYPHDLHDLDRRMWQPGGFHRDIKACRREWATASGRANFVTPDGMATDPDMPEDRHDILRLMTLRSNDQFNTTVYGYDDRFRGIKGTRRVVLMNANDMARFDLAEGELVTLETAAEDGVERVVTGLRVTAYDIPEGCCGGYYPECNPLIPLWHHAERAKVPAGKSIPVRVRKAQPLEIALPATRANGAEDYLGRDPGASVGDFARDLVATASISGAMARSWVRARPLGALLLGAVLGAALPLVAGRRKRP